MAIDFGYFTLSDNFYPDNPRSANDFVLEIREQAILADKLGYSSAWIGEHHFDRLGVNSRPDILLASIIPETTNIRLAPAVNVLPIHHPIHVAEMWATLDLLSGGRVDYACGRGYDADEYHPFGADFMTSAEVFEEGMDIVWKAWTEKGPWSHKGKYYDIQDMDITPKPIQDPIPFYVASFSETSSKMAGDKGHNIIYAPFAAAMVYGGLDKAVDSYRENCVKAGNKPGRAMCSYFIHISDTPEEDDIGRQAMMDYFQHCVLRAFPDGTYLPYLVNRVGQQFISDITPVLGKAGVDIQSWRVLIALYQRGGQPVGALSDLTSINFSTLSRVLGRMEKKDLIRRMRDADDARSFTVELTATGRSVTETILPQAVALEAKVTGDFSEAELAMLRQLLGKLYAGLEGDVNETDDRLAG